MKISKLTALLILLASQHAQAQMKFKMDFSASSAEATVVQTSVSTLVQGMDMIFSPTVANNTSRALHLNTIRYHINTTPLLVRGIPVMIGADEMLRKEGNMYQVKLGDALRNDDNNTFLMLKPSSDHYLLVGVISWRRFMNHLHFDDNLNIVAESVADNRELKAGEQLKAEKLVCLQGKSWQDLLEKYALLIKNENNVPKPPAVHWKGWATWDYYRQYFTTESVERNTKEMQALMAGTNIIQIDGGWWKQRGDYFDVRDDLEGGIKGMIQKIHQAGFKAGLHFDGYRASSGARIVKEHPEYFVHNAAGKLVELDRDKVTNDPLVVWDYSHPGAQAYITSVMKNARENWGVDYFKIDFMRQGLVTGVNHLPVTNVERYRMGVVAMNKGIGNAYFLACSPNFGVNIGLIPNTRTGPDIDPDYEAVVSRAAHNAGSYYFSSGLYNIDPDYLVLRSAAESDAEERKKPSLTEEQGKMWANYVAIHGNVRLASDEMRLLTASKKAVLKEAFAMPFFSKAVPVDWWNHFKTDKDGPNCYLAKGEDGSICIGLFNWESAPAEFILQGLKAGEQLAAYDKSLSLTATGNSVTVQLKGIRSVLFRYKGSRTFEQLAKSLGLPGNEKK